MKVIISGGTGFVGKHLIEYLLSKGYEIFVLTRRLPPHNPQSNLRYFEWNPQLKTFDKKPFEMADAIINLAGAGIADERWTTQRKETLVNSRINANETIVKALQEVDNHIKMVISTSAIGWYGLEIPSDMLCMEDMPAAADFLAQLCQKWENSIKPVKGLGKKLCILRTGIVLGTDGGAYPKMTQPLNYGVKTLLGSGKQVMSWIHIKDHCAIYYHLLENDLEGVFNSVAPNPVTQNEFLNQVQKSKKKYSLPVKVPKFLLRMILGELSDMLTSSAKVSSQKIEQAGYKFKYPNIEDAVEDLEK
ncbi:TIGR01777 family oxidoreductase [Riemerella anatipestifer]|uniref:TIGR01777 family oxidoreductase n=1 Tax=Riemerella anatipestifer TaxID=34085 RepID=UPI0021B09CEB|nr:TIGR01777 family oxidoreductase [Riemerella anatipestifer]MCT6764038.1 TIGR01777 family oxidoreductase [Riemerella anatipestifer]MCT6768217.1 TIGR01777 family oxidoreductase [Riemerella anatipestifer]MCU7592735.1 TIGR01777 family oxidoreductase [Riemerella anatipestifer]MCU7600996.1 TIGR01777 family oxidoreductase [Riemerella anatipestifer]MCU7609130.1 TIGR01777 family oxidoreductase [Riemerella anatipestifer]